MIWVIFFVWIICVLVILYEFIKCVLNGETYTIGEILFTIFSIVMPPLTISSAIIYAERWDWNFLEKKVINKNKDKE